MKRQRGFSSVEALLAATLFAFLTMTVVGAIIYGRTAVAQAGTRNRASKLAEEGIEAVRNIRDANYASLTDGTFALSKSGGSWTLTAGNETIGTFSRQIIISADGTNRKRIQSRVTWPEGSATSESTVSARLTNWQASIAVVVKSWLLAFKDGSIDLASTANGFRVATEGDYAYIVRNSGTPNFYVVNISNPSTPTLAGTATLPATLTNIAVKGDYAYVTSTANAAELITVNVSNPAAPVQTATDDIIGNADATGIFISGNYGYVTRLANLTFSEFAIVSLANPAVPTAAGGYGNNINMREVYVVNNHAYIVTDSDTQEILVVDVTIPLFPQFRSAVNLAGTTNATVINGRDNHIYVSQSSTLRSLDITNATSPVLRGSLTAASTVQDISLLPSGPNYLFVGTSGGTAEFQVINATNPAAMTVGRTVDITGISGILYGVAYNATHDIVVGASSIDTQEGVIFAPN